MTDQTDNTDTPEHCTPATAGQPLASLSGLSEAIAVGAQLAGVGPRIVQLCDPDRDGPGSSVPLALVERSDGLDVVVLHDAIKVLDEQAPGPRRRMNITTLTEERSFIEHVRRWGSDSTVIYADTAGLGFVAVLDDHPAGPDIAATAWRQHRAVYACPRSAEWLAWTGLDGRPMTQVQFGDFIEARLEDLTLAKDGKGNPLPEAVRPVDMLTVARQLTIRTKGTFRRDIDPTTGAFVFENKSEHETGSTVIPRAFAIAIPVFDGGERYVVEARVRFTLGEEGPRFAFVLHRRKEIERDAFDEVRRRVEFDTGRLVLAGTP